MAAVMNGTEQQFSVGPEAILTVRAFSGSVRVQAGEEGRITVRAHDGDDEEQAFSATQHGDLVAVRAEDESGEEQEVDLEISVPRGCEVHVSTTDGDIVITSTGGATSAETEDGTIQVTGSEGRLTIKSSDGDVNVRGASGDCSVTANDGTVKLQNMQGTLVALLADGDLEVSKSQLSRVTVRADDGEVRVETTLSGDGRYVITTQDGDAVLRARGGAGATVHLQSAEGEMRLDANGPVEILERTRKHRHARFGDGRATIVLDSREGDVRLVAEIEIGSEAKAAGLPLPRLPELPELPRLPDLPELPRTPAGLHPEGGPNEDYVQQEPSTGQPVDAESDRERTVSVLEQLERGEITVEEAMARLGES